MYISEIFLQKSLTVLSFKVFAFIVMPFLSLTNSGYTAFQISSWRPNSNILVFTSNKRILSQLNLLWGVKSFFYDKFESTDNTIEEVNSIAKEEGYIKKGDMLINLASMPISNKGMVNTMRISQL